MELFGRTRSGGIGSSFCESRLPNIDDFKIPKNIWPNKNIRFKIFNINVYYLRHFDCRELQLQHV